MKAEEFEQEWKQYCDSKGGGAITMNLKDVAQHFARYGYEQAQKDFMEKASELLVNCIEDFMARRLEIWDEECKKQTLENLRNALKE